MLAIFPNTSSPSLVLKSYSENKDFLVEQKPKSSICSQTLVLHWHGYQTFQHCAWRKGQCAAYRYQWHWRDNTRASEIQGKISHINLLFKVCLLNGIWAYGKLLSEIASYAGNSPFVEGLKWIAADAKKRRYFRCAWICPKQSCVIPTTGRSTRPKQWE